MDILLFMIIFGWVGFFFNWLIFLKLKLVGVLMLFLWLIINFLVCSFGGVLCWLFFVIKLALLMLSLKLVVLLLLMIGFCWDVRLVLFFVKENVFNGFLVLLVLCVLVVVLKVLMAKLFVLALGLVFRVCFWFVSDLIVKVFGWGVLVLLVFVVFICWCVVFSCLFICGVWFIKFCSCVMVLLVGLVGCLAAIKFIIVINFLWVLWVVLKNELLGVIILLDVVLYSFFNVMFNFIILFNWVVVVLWVRMCNFCCNWFSFLFGIGLFF